MGLIQTLGTGHGHLKAGILGFAGAGKTFTGAMLAVGVRRHFSLPGPIVMFDTEGGAAFIAGRIKETTGQELLGVRSRAFSDLMTTGQEAVAMKASVLIVDSITHVWQEVGLAMLKQINERLAQAGRSRITRLEFQHMAQLKGLWEDWTTFYLNSPLHIIVCGRAGFTWDFERDDETGKKDLIKTGVKMKVESEFGFEPSLLIEMAREQTPDGRGGFTIHRRATVLKDRFAAIDGQQKLDPDFEFFAPHVNLLVAGAHNVVDTTVRTETGADVDGDSQWARERKTRTIIAEEIQGELVAAYPGQDAKGKAKKAELIYTAFGTRSWTAVESMPSERLRAGLATIRAAIHGSPPDDLPAEPASAEVSA